MIRSSSPAPSSRPSVCQEYPAETPAGLLLHTGQETGWIADGVLAAPWWKVL